MSVTITRDDWLQALSDVGISDEHDADAVTVGEFAKMMELHTATASRHLIALEKAGKATRTRKLTHASDGRMMRLVAYRLIK